VVRIASPHDASDDSECTVIARYRGVILVLCEGLLRAPRTCVGNYVSYCMLRLEIAQLWNSKTHISSNATSVIAVLIQTCGDVLIRNVLMVSEYSFCYWPVAV
jgi:hypothetical protein